MSTIPTRAGIGRPWPRRLVALLAATVLAGAGLVAWAGPAQASAPNVVT